MANQLLNRTIYVDTTFSSYQTAIGTSLGNEPRNLRVVGFKLLGGSVASTAVVTEPTSGKVFWQGQAGIGLNDSQMFHGVQSVRDFGVTIAGTGAILLVFTV